jgi:hypothetical protein
MVWLGNMRLGLDLTQFTAHHDGGLGSEIAIVLFGLKMVAERGLLPLAPSQ